MIEGSIPSAQGVCKYRDGPEVMDWTAIREAGSAVTVVVRMVSDSKAIAWLYGEGCV